MMNGTRARPAALQDRLQARPMRRRVTRPLYWLKSRGRLLVKVARYYDNVDLYEMSDRFVHAVPTWRAELGLLLVLASADPVALAHREHEHATVANFARARGLNDCPDCFVDDLVGDDHFDLHLRQQAHVVLLAAVDGCVAFLFPVSADLGHGHPRHTQLDERVLHDVHLVRADDGLNQLHRILQSCDPA